MAKYWRSKILEEQNIGGAKYWRSKILEGQNIGGAKYWRGKILANIHVLIKFLTVINWWITSVLYSRYFKDKIWIGKILENRLSFIKFVNILSLRYYAMYSALRAFVEIHRSQIFGCWNRVQYSVCLLTFEVFSTTMYYVCI